MKFFNSNNIDRLIELRSESFFERIDVLLLNFDNNGSTMNQEAQRRVSDSVLALHLSISPLCSLSFLFYIYTSYCFTLLTLCGLYI